MTGREGERERETMPLFSAIDWKCLFCEGGVWTAMRLSGGAFGEGAVLAVARFMCPALKIESEVGFAPKDGAKMRPKIFPNMPKK